MTMLEKINYPARPLPPPVKTGPGLIFDGAQVTETPLQTFLADMVIPAGANQYIDVNAAMAGRCTGFALVGVANPVQVSINGGGYRTIPGNMVVDGAIIGNLSIITGVLTGCILQLHGV